MDTIGLIMDLSAFIFILLSCVYAIKIYRLFEINNFLWLICATVYGTILRGIHLARNFNLPVPSPLVTSRLFSIFYFLLFLGIMAYYRPLKRVWNDITRAAPKEESVTRDEA